MNSKFFGRTLMFAVALLLLASFAFGQAQSGNLYGTVKDDKGSPLPGVSVTLSGVGANQVQVSNAEGEFRFLGLSPGSYKLDAELEGFSMLEYPNVVVSLGRNTTLDLTMNAKLEETITVTTESPLLDSRKIETGSSIAKTELEKIPSARDPWVILQTTPGVLVDRVNVGGNESGQQSTYARGGTASTDSTWSVDGVEITDVGALGSSPSYYDFDAFSDMQVATGGADATLRTGGVGINMVTKRGTNQWRGSGRYIYDDSSLQSNFNAKTSDFAKAGPWNNNHGQPVFTQGNRINKVEDYGLELGGPIVKDKLWIWGSYGQTDVKLFTVSDFHDNTKLETYNGKINWQVVENNSATFFYSDNQKVKIGRNAGPTRPQETTWDQGVFGGKPTIWKVEDTHIFGSNFFLTALYDQTKGGFELVPEGGVNTTVNAALDSAFVAHNTYLLYQSPRPQKNAKADGSYFFNTGNVSHELKFGVNYRKAEVGSYSHWPNFGLDLNYYQAYGYNYNIVQLTRDANLKYEAKYQNGYLQDTLTAGNLTANIGVRYDHQDGKNLATSVLANPAVPNLLPAASYGGGSMGFDAWTNWSPRLGLTYALGAERKTLLRASYSRFAQALGGGSIGWVNPMYPGAYVYEYYNDLNHDGHAQANEIIPGILFTNHSYDPANPSVPAVNNHVNSSYKAPTTDEVTLGIEHALLPEFVVGLNYTYRQLKDIADSVPWVYDANSPNGRPATAADFVLKRTLTGTLPNGSTYSTPVYDLSSAVSSNGGYYLFNSDKKQKYSEVALTFNKRLANRWMMRGNFTWNDNKWDVPSGALADRTPTFGGGFDGDRVLTCSGSGSGAKSNVCISSKWAYSLNGMYQIAPDKMWGFNVAAALNGRQGYANPYFVRVTSLAKFGGGAQLVDVTNRPDDFKNGDLNILDLRIEKEFRFNAFGLTLGVDCFNVTNDGTVLQRNLRLGRSPGSTGGVNPQPVNGSDWVTEVVSPRIFRLGAKFSFN